MKYDYPYAVLLGLLYYPLQQIVFFLRFGRWNMTFQQADLLLPLVGILSFLFLFSVLNSTRKKQAQVFLWIVFLLIAVPVSIFGSLFGGLMGPVGIVAYGIAPVVFVLLFARAIGRKVWR